MQARSYEGFVREMRQGSRVLPSEFFRDSMTIQVGTKNIEPFMINGDATSSVAAFIPGARVLFTGDALVFPMSYAPTSNAIRLWLSR